MVSLPLPGGQSGVNSPGKTAQNPMMSLSCGSDFQIRRSFLKEFVYQQTDVSGDLIFFSRSGKTSTRSVHYSPDKVLRATPFKSCDLFHRVATSLKTCSISFVVMAFPLAVLIVRRGSLRSLRLFLVILYRTKRQSCGRTGCSPFAEVSAH